MTNRSRRMAVRIAAWLAAFLAAALLVGVSQIEYYRLSLPNYDGSARVAGLDAPVQILRDAHAIPHIVARTRHDALFALGYSEAEDRLWQMEFSRRAAQGRLAALLGRVAVPTDIFMRTLGLYRLSEQSVAALDPASRSLLQAYADGVNAFLATHKGPLPIEFALADDNPEPWRPADSVAVLKLMQLELSEDMFREAARARLASVLDKQQIEDLYPPYPGDPPNPLPDYLFDYFGRARNEAALAIPDTTASNDWVVSGARSTTGMPLLANDPHLFMTIPSVWYLVHLSYPGSDVVGAALAGEPGVTLGRNRYSAWGMTNTGPDTQDLYLEKLDPAHSGAYIAPQGSAPFATRRERIKVRFGTPIWITVRETRHGPVLPVGAPLLKLSLPKGYVLSLAWTALTPNDRTIQSLLAVDDVRSNADLKVTLRDFVSPMENIVHAHTDGHIGLFLPGYIPIRAQDNDSLGLVPEKGWDARYDWQGFIPFDGLPRIDDPPSGQIATANNKTIPLGYSRTITREWEDWFRVQRISELLATTPRHSIDSFKAIQLDIHDRYAQELVPLLLNAAPWPSAQARRAAALLAKWDFAMDRDRPEPLIFAAWERALVRGLLADKLGKMFPAFWSHHAGFVLDVLRNVDGQSRWCGAAVKSSAQDCRFVIRRALADALAELSSQYGDDIDAWRWGEAHYVIDMHQPFGQIPVLGTIFNRAAPASGGAYTIRRGDFDFSSDHPYAAIHGAGYRAIYDLAHPDQSLFVISTGESGNVYSPYYDDLVSYWADGRYITIPTAPGAIAKTTRFRFVLEPQTSARAP